MPELPEVEVSRQGIAPFLVGQTVVKVAVRQPKLRWPIPDAIQELVGATITSVRRRAKYLLIETERGTALIHLGMSGRLHILNSGCEPAKHDHFDILLDNGKLLRFTDPRRFGSLLWCYGDPLEHPLLRHLGVEPLTDAFDADYLQNHLAKARRAVKVALMDNAIVVGVGNIYANEALFNVGIDPRRPACSLNRDEIERLVAAIKAILAAAIVQGGTTLRDFAQADGKPGYFVQKLLVYGRAGEKCLRCHGIIESQHLGQRNTFFCPKCQN